MKREEMERIYKDYKKTETEILQNNGVAVRFGDTHIKVKALEWDMANEFEEEIQRIFSKFDDIKKINLANANINEVSNIMRNLLGDDLLSLANKATAGTVTLKYIRDRHATKKEIINIVTQALNENYGGLKNLIAQRPL